MDFFRKHLFAFAAFLITIIRGSMPALAWHTDTCDGETMGFRSFRDVKMERCSIPVGSAREAMFLYSANRWNELQGLGDRFNMIGGPNSCVIEHGDGASDAGVVDADDIDGNAGLTVMQFEACVWPYFDAFDGGVEEADIMTSSSLPTGAMSPLSSNLGGRETTVHEMGHAIGMNHEDDVMSVMCTAGSCGKFGRWNVLGDLYDYTEQEFPDDVDFMYNYHNTAGTGEDLATSNWRYDPGVGGPIRVYGSATNRSVCAGSTTPVVFVVGNRAQDSITSANPFVARVVASTNSTISRNDTTIWNGTVWAARGVHGHLAVNANVPNSPGTTYYVGFILDPNEERDEQREGDNAVDLGLRLVVQSCP
jgi:hypothetical protein